MSCDGFNHFGVLFGKMEKKEGKILAVFGPTSHHLQDISLQKWLHMEKCRFLEENALTGELAYS